MPDTPRRYEWLLFDADNTLWDFSASEARALEQTLVARDIPWSKEVLGDYRIINRRVWDEYENGTLPKSQLRTIRFQRLLEQYRLDHPADELSLDYRNYLSQSTHLMAGAIDILRRTRPTYRQGLITNGLHEVQRPRLAATGLGNYFDFIVISDEIGVAKPSPDFFDAAYRQMEAVDKSKVLVIGDNPNADVRGALDYGFDACWLRLPGMADRPKLGATYTIRDIRDLEAVLDL